MANRNGAAKFALLKRARECAALSHAGYRLLHALLDRGITSWPSTRTMSRDAAMSQRHVRRALDELGNLGLLARSEGKKGRGILTNTINLQWDDINNRGARASVRPFSPDRGARASDRGARASDRGARASPSEPSQESKYELSVAAGRLGDHAIRAEWFGKLQRLPAFESIWREAIDKECQQAGAGIEHLRQAIGG